jgi:hypothetical protein
LTSFALKLQYVAHRLAFLAQIVMSPGQAVVIVLLVQAVLNNNLTKLDKLIKDGMPVDSRCKV